MFIKFRHSGLSYVRQGRLTEQDQRPDPRRIDRRVRQEQPRILQSQSVFEPDITCDACNYDCDCNCDYGQAKSNYKSVRFSYKWKRSG
jgi:hypothetical protein